MTCFQPLSFSKLHYSSFHHPSVTILGRFCSRWILLFIHCPFSWVPAHLPFNHVIFSVATNHRTPSAGHRLGGRAHPGQDAPQLRAHRKPSHAHTGGDKWDMLFHPVCSSLGCGGKQEGPGRTHVGLGRHLFGVCACLGCAGEKLEEEKRCRSSSPRNETASVFVGERENTE